MAKKYKCPDCSFPLNIVNTDGSEYLSCNNCGSVFGCWDSASCMFKLPQADFMQNPGTVARLSLIARVEVVDENGCMIASADRPSAAQGVHKDAGKDRVDLVPIEGIHAAARAMSYGLTKYEIHNYRKGIAWASLYASIMRHLLMWFWDGRPDEESGLSHLDHAAADVLMLCAIVDLHPALDDRPCKKD